MTLHGANDPAALVLLPLDLRYRTISDAAAIGARLLDDAHMTWLVAKSAAEQALDTWREPVTCTRAAAYAAYVAAVDREDAAARDFERLCEITAPYRVASVPTNTASASADDARSPS